MKQELLVGSEAKYVGAYCAVESFMLTSFLQRSSCGSHPENDLHFIIFKL